MSGGTFAVLAGLLIVIAGLALLGMQMTENHGKDIEKHNFTLINAQVGANKLRMETGFLGMPILFLGIFLLMVGAIASRGNQ